VSGFNTIGEYVNYASEKTVGAFRDVRSIANAYKHLYTDIDPKKTNYNTISSPAVVESIEIHNDAVGINLISTEFAPGSTMQEKVSFTRIDGSKSEFLPVMNAVVEFWKNEIYKNA
jgi:Fe-S-cluster formation regulator IscX/YfhJ